MTTQTALPDLAQLKAGMKATWMAGDFGQIANFISGEGGEFCRSPRPQARRYGS